MTKNKKIISKSDNKAGNLYQKRSPIILQLLWLVILILLSIPLYNELVKSKDTAEVSIENKDSMKSANWFDGKFQWNTEEELKKNWVFKKSFTEFNNDLDYFLFNKVNVNGFVMGKNDYIFSSTQIESYLGTNYLGEDSIKKKLLMIHALQDTFKKRDIQFVVVYAPDKVSFMPEYLPTTGSLRPGRTNYNDYIRLSNQLGVNYIDMEKWFLSMKDTSKYPLFPQYGHHWSYYGGCLAIDSFIRYVKKRMPDDSFPYWGWNEIELDTPQFRDADILGRMGLSFKLPTFKMAYPKVASDYYSHYNNKKVLGIGDSYYSDFLFNYVMKYVFDGSDFWYYYSKVLRDTSDRSLHEVWEKDLKTEIEKNKVIVLLATGGDLTNLGWGFVEDAYELYTNPKAFYSRKQSQNKLNPYRKKVHSSPDLLDEATNESLQDKVPIDSVVNEMAREMMKEDRK